MIYSQESYPLTSAEVDRIWEEERVASDDDTLRDRALFRLSRAKAQKLAEMQADNQRRNDVAKNAFGRWEALQPDEPWDPIAMVDTIAYGCRLQGVQKGQIILYAQPYDDPDDGKHFEPGLDICGAWIALSDKTFELPSDYAECSTYLEIMVFDDESGKLRYVEADCSRATQHELDMQAQIAALN